jgi:hypothetical protein
VNNAKIVTERISLAEWNAILKIRQRQNRLHLLNDWLDRHKYIIVPALGLLGGLTLVGVYLLRCGGAE